MGRIERRLVIQKTRWRRKWLNPPAEIDASRRGRSRPHFYVMRLKTVPFGPSSEVHWGSDVTTLNFSKSDLVVRVASTLDATGLIHGLEVIFSDASAFRYLDELDLARYWTSEGFVRGFHVLEVTEGGWAHEEAELQGYSTPRREWLVVTGNGCVSVFAPTEPQVNAISWQRDA